MQVHTPVPQQEFSHYPACQLCTVQVIGQALDAAQHRRDRLAAMTSTPESGPRVGSKRKELKKTDPPSCASTTASSSKSIEKVTPDPKHVRTGSEPAPTPKALFGSPPGDGMAVEEGLGLSKLDGWTVWSCNPLLFRIPPEPSEPYPMWISIFWGGIWWYSLSMGGITIDKIIRKSSKHTHRYMYVYIYIYN